MRITSGRDRQPLAEAKALLPGFLGASRLIGLNNLHQACTRAHREAQLAFEIQDHFEGATIAQLIAAQSEPVAKMHTRQQNQRRLPADGPSLWYAGMYTG